MKICIINHSDSRGGASVVSYRLMEALQALGHEASMLVAHKSGSNDAVYIVKPQWRLKAAFLAEHLRILAGNGFNRADMFKVSIATDGMPLAEHPLVRQADAVFLNWVNQGMLSLDEISRIAASKPTIWTMHDMWNLTGICHHAATCRAFTKEPGCGNCPFLHSRASVKDLSRRTWQRKKTLYDNSGIRFVAVSSWLKKLCDESSLMAGREISLIPNAFPVEDFYIDSKGTTPVPGIPQGKKIILMGAARLDDPVKGLDYAVEALNRLDRHDTVAVFFGDIRNASALDSLHFPHVCTGSVTDPAVLHELYARATVLMSTSRYETLPGTLIEGQAAGCTPVSFDSGGQRDIIEHGLTGYLVPPYDTQAFAQALNTALDTPVDPTVLRRSVTEKFSAQSVASRYIDLLARP